MVEISSMHSFIKGDGMKCPAVRFYWVQVGSGVRLHWAAQKWTRAETTTQTMDTVPLEHTSGRDLAKVPRRTLSTLSCSCLQLCSRTLTRFTPNGQWHGHFCRKHYRHPWHNMSADGQIQRMIKHDLTIYKVYKWRRNTYPTTTYCSPLTLRNSLGCLSVRHTTLHKAKSLLTSMLNVWVLFTITVFFFYGSQ